MLKDAHFSDYIVYADESGDHGLAHINPENPVFVLAFCIFNKFEYTEKIVPEVQKLKFRFWGHDNIILHSRDIRKSSGDFSILQNKDIREEFICKINETIESSPFVVIAAGINKLKHKNRYIRPTNPYDLALRFCLERLKLWLGEKADASKIVHLVFEERGKSEDNALELEFHRFYENTKHSGKRKIKFMPKKHNSTGLQFADLVAYPIARNVINPTQGNRAYDIIKQKFRKGDNMKIDGYGLKIFP
jgi:Protein of unknown function (DUF3800)